MAKFRNDFGEDRVVPTLGYVLVPAGADVTVPDDEWEHWDAGGWTALTPDPRPAEEPVAPTPAAPPAASPSKAATTSAAAAPSPVAAPTAPAESEATR